MKIEWTDPAIWSAIHLRFYIAQDSTQYADRFINKIFDAVEQFEKFPLLEDGFRRRIVKTFGS